MIDVAIIIGPGNPPTLAVLAWQWLNAGEADDQAKGALACLLLLALLLVLAVVTTILWRTSRLYRPHPDGRRRQRFLPLPGRCVGFMLPLSGLLCVVFLAWLAHGALPAMHTINNSLWLALLSALIAAAVCLLWLEWGPQGHQR